MMLININRIRKLSERKKPERPFSISVIGWVFAIIGGQLMIGALAFFILNTRIEVLFEDAVFKENAFFLDIFVGIYNNYILVSSIQFILGSYMLVSGIYFLKLKSWARTAVEAICWVLFVFLVVFAVYWVFMWIDFSGNVLESTKIDLSLLKLVGIFIGVFSLAVYGGLLYVIIRLTRSSRIRSFMVK